jgi:hypothetical protein
MARKVPYSLQDYPRVRGGFLAEYGLFPKSEPPFSMDIADEAIKRAFARAGKNKKGDELRVYRTPAELVKLCIHHLKERSDPILSPFFFSQMNVEDVFDVDAIAHEMQRQRMKIGLFYQYLMIELMRCAQRTQISSIKSVFDGSREGDVVADVSTPAFSKGLRLYISVKKSSDTVGGQDIGGVIRRLEGVAIAEKNLNSPYLCVIAIATPSRGKLEGYREARSIRRKEDGTPYSPNCEFWMPGFVYPYITGLSPRDIYKESIKIVKDFLGFYTIKVREEATQLLKKKFIEMELSDKEGNIELDRFFNFVLS